MNEMVKNLNLVYTLDGKIYINLTNKCTNCCVFCIRNSSDEIEGKNLWLSTENYSTEDVIKQFKEIYEKNTETQEVIFCGFGEPLIKFDIFCEVAKYIKDNCPKLSVRVNTNGQANLIHKRDIIPELAKYVDAVSISLNGENQDIYNKNSQPQDKENAYTYVKDFIKECVQIGIDTTATVVTGCEKALVNIDECKKIADSLGSKFRIREWLPKGY
ncbi:radical SAM protein [bacterium]|nr:radical SAM protein [bacterium]